MSTAISNPWEDNLQRNITAWNHFAHKSQHPLLECPECYGPAELVVGRNESILLLCGACQRGWTLADLLQDSPPPPSAQPGEKNPHSSISGLCRRPFLNKTNIIPFIIITTLIVISIISSSAGGYYFAKDEFYNVETSVSPINIGTALEYLSQRKRSHQQFIDNPSLLENANTPLLGDLEFHSNCVTKYQQLHELLIRLSEGR